MNGRHHQNLIKKARGLPPIRTAVVHPVDAVSLVGAIEAAKQKLIVPVLVGPEHKIRAAARAAKLDLSALSSSCRRSIARQRPCRPSRWRATARSRR